MQIVHDKVAYLNHVVVKLVIVAQKLISLQLSPSHLKQLLEELSEARKVKIVLLEELIADGRSSQFHDEIVDCFDMILDFASVVALHLVRLHLLPIGLLELGGELLVLLLGDEIFAHFVLRVQIELVLDLGRTSVDFIPSVCIGAFGRLAGCLAVLGIRALSASAASTCTTLLKFDDLMQVLVLEQEGQRQVPSHITLRLFSAFLGKPALIFEPSPFFVLELFVLLEELGVDAI